MILYGYVSRTHHTWSKVLTVMGPEGADVITAHIEPGSGIAAKTDPGRLPQYHEKRDGALAALVERYGIVVLEKADWEAKKAEIAD